MIWDNSGRGVSHGARGWVWECWHAHENSDRGGANTASAVQTYRDKSQHMIRGERTSHEVWHFETLFNCTFFRNNARSWAMADSGTLWP